MTRFFSRVPFAVSPLDPATHAGVAIVLAFAASLATGLPARRACGWIR